MNPPSDRRGGMALAVVLLLMLALALLAHGALLLARQELAASRAGLRMLQADAAAEAAVQMGLAQPVPAASVETRLWDGIPVASTELATGTARAWLRRLSREHWLLEGIGQVGAAPWTSTDARLVWVMDEAARVGSFQGVVEVGRGAPVAILGSVDAGHVRRDVEPLDPLPCRSWFETLDSLYRDAAPGAVARVDVITTGEPRLGLMSGDTLLDRIPVRVEGEGTPIPRADLGRCEVANPWNWGDPDRWDRPCGAHLASRAALGDLRVNGGVGQGLLVVRGDLELSGTRFHGILLVGGLVRLVAGAEVVGLVRAAGGVEIDASSGVVGSGCRALRALEGRASGLRTPLELPGGRIGPW